MDNLSSPNDVKATIELYWNWAANLRREAIQKYSPIGKKAYDELKENARTESKVSETQSITIERLPYLIEFISREDAEDMKGQGTQEEENPNDSSEREKEYVEVDMSYLRPSSERELSSSDAIVAPNGREKYYYLFGRSSHIFLMDGIYCLCSPVEKKSSDNVWLKKLEDAHKLLTYAWVIADDVCNLEDMEDSERQKIVRDSKQFL
ncbi:MAG: hypothetical protein HC921_16685 [Synechococcaceae cyanobacterium SM2_3_1]|nr:hypothetical protein [Synechococcaceae cyanobacterium SM2_3_1]